MLVLLAFPWLVSVSLTEKNKGGFLVDVHIMANFFKSLFS